MKYFFAAYWIMGCLIVGTVIGIGMRDCPDDPPLLNSFESIAAIAEWPAILVAAFHIKGISKSQCKRTRYDSGSMG